MSLIKGAFWVSVIILLLPSDERKQAELYGKAASAVTWAATFCDRNAETCAKSAELWVIFKQKAEFGARMAMDIAQRSLSGVEPVSVPSAAQPPQSGSDRPQPATDRGTLAPDDLRNQWRGPPQKPRA